MGAKEQYDVETTKREEIVTERKNTQGSVSVSR